MSLGKADEIPVMFFFQTMRHLFIISVYGGLL